jgi:hypothetical protein
VKKAPKLRKLSLMTRFKNVQKYADEGWARVHKLTAEISELQAECARQRSAAEFHALRAARHEGYITRVKETEGRDAVPHGVIAQRTDPIGELREKLAICPEAEANKILDAISPDLTKCMTGYDGTNGEDWGAR